jgi:hypothetical protein
MNIRSKKNATPRASLPLLLRDRERVMAMELQAPDTLPS